jgi:hypothetical protein
METTRRGKRVVCVLAGARPFFLRSSRTSTGALRLSSSIGGSDVAGRGGSEVLRQSLAEVGRALAEGRTTSEEVTRACLEQVDRTAPLNAFVSRHSDQHLLSLAALSDKRRRDGLRTSSPSSIGLVCVSTLASTAALTVRCTGVGKLEGIPVAVKDSFNTHDLPTTCASRMLKGAIPLRRRRRRSAVSSCVRVSLVG